jgi:carbon-monoxide dehydrogenase large subunit
MMPRRIDDTQERRRVMEKFGFGQPVTRLEDARLLTGRGQFIEDRPHAGAAHALVLRSPHAHARIVAIDVEAARGAAGVLAVLTGSDALSDGIGSIPCNYDLPNFPGAPKDAVIAKPPYPVLAIERVRFVGDPVALIVATTKEAARDAAELVFVDYEMLPAVIDPAAAAASGAPAIWPEAPGNIAFTWSAGDDGAVRAAFAGAARVVELELVNNRVVVSALETRGAIGTWDAATRRYTLSTASQMPHGLKADLAEVLGVAPDAVRVLIGDVGGGFGAKNALYPEHVLVLWASRRVGRTVSWIGDRGEAFLADYHGRGNLTRAALALDGEGRFIALRIETLADLGAYLAPKGPLSPTSNTPALAGSYRTPAIHVAVRGIFTNTVPTDVYRGAGRPEAIYALERVVDAAARELGIDPVELRRRNLVRPEDLPHRTPLGLVYDNGDQPRVLDAALQRADWSGFPARRAEAARRGRLRGIGLVHYTERVAGGWSEEVDLEIDPEGRAIAYLGTMSNGQGHETAYTQLLAEWLGIGPEDIRIVQGDTDLVRSGHGTGGSASLAIAGAALSGATTAMIERCRRVAADVLEAATADIGFAEGRFTIVGTDRSATLRQVARAAHASGVARPLWETGHFKPSGPTFPNGCHVCEVEIDPETGTLDIVAYALVHDFGRVLNPLLLAGQVHGGIAQGLGQAGLERVAYDAETGQPLAASLMDYCLPRAADLPDFDFAALRTSSSNPLDVKGCGEAGAAGAPPALMNAVIDALAPLGIRHVDMPATPERLWRAIAAARS